MRILHTSDWHLGQYFYGKSRAAEHQHFLNWLTEQVSEHSVDAIIVAGDIFDTGTPPSYAREMYFDFVVHLNQLNCQLIILAGNHDSVAMLGESKQLLAHLSTRVIPSVSDDIAQQVFVVPDKQGKPGLVLCAIPFIRPRDVIKSQAGQSGKEKQQALQQGIHEHYQRLYQQAKSLASFDSNSNADPDVNADANVDANVEVNKVLPIVATGHLTTVGVTSSESVRDIYIGTLEAFPARDFPDADYIALGHIHRPQKVAKTEHIRYCGSPIPLSFDEAAQDKQVLLVDFVADKLQQVTAVKVPCFQPLFMLNTTLEQLNHEITQLVDEVQKQKILTKGQTIWLDIEINSVDYLQDLQSRIEGFIKDLPIELLRVRRSKSARQLMPGNKEKITLNELSVDDVFESRLAQEVWQTDDELARKQRLTALFLQAADSVTTKDGQ